MTNSSHRFVIDTNIIVSAVFFPQGFPRQAMDWAGQQGKILASETTFAELSNVLLRPRFERYATLAFRHEVLDDFGKNAEFVEIKEPIVACRDPKDDQYLALAINGGAECIVTGDEDLLVLNPFRAIPILTARLFLEHQGSLFNDQR
jgi:uncharacterized protein